MISLPPALRHRKFALFFTGMLVSVAGSRMQFWGLLWHVRTLSDAPIALGLVGLFRMIPILVFSLPGGVVADTLNRRKVLLGTETLLGLVAAALGFATLRGQDSLLLLYGLTALQATLFSFELPARQAVIPNLVPPRDLASAFSLQSMAFQLGSILGPMASGLVIAHAGQAWVYFANALSYGVLVLSLILVGPIAQDTPETSGPPVDVVAIREGLSFILHQPLILSSMVLDFFATFFASANALLPIFARDILKVGAVGYGWLSAASSAGALGAALVLSQIPDFRRQGRWLVGSVILFGMATVVFGISRNFWLSFGALAVAGAADTVSTVIRATLRQLLTPDRLRGRMTSINQIFFLGGPMLGEMEAGAAAQVLGAPLAVVTGGVGCVLATFWVVRRWPELLRYDRAKA